MVTTQGEKHPDEMMLWGPPRLDASDPGDGDIFSKGLDHWGDLVK